MSVVFKTLTELWDSDQRVQVSIHSDPVFYTSVSFKVKKISTIY